MQVKRTPKKLRISKETLGVLNGSLKPIAGGLIASDGPEHPCNYTDGGSCGEWTCLGATCDYLCATDWC